MRTVSFPEVREFFRGKTVALVGSGPGVLDNQPGFVDSHDVVCRVSNYKTGIAQGLRCDVFYSFFGTSIAKPREQLIADGVKLLLCKLPDSAPIPKELRWWHEARGKVNGFDYRYVYEARKNWWPAPVFIPDDERFLSKFRLLGNHQPTTGFAAILDLLECEPALLYLTGFDGFTSGIHNVDEPWRQKNTDDPIGHRPDLEMQWLRDNRDRYPLKFDRRLSAVLA